MSYRLEALAAHHELNDFRCGAAALDEWLRRSAHNAAGRGTRTYVLLAEPGTVVGYFAIAPHLLGRDVAPRSIGRGAPRRQIPAILLAKLALDEHLQGRGLGGELLLHALTTIAVAARAAGGRVIVVDAIDDAAAGFYRAHDFQAIPGDRRSLVIKISTAARALGLPWP